MILSLKKIFLRILVKFNLISIAVKCSKALNASVKEKMAVRVKRVDEGDTRQRHIVELTQVICRRWLFDKLSCPHVSKLFQIIFSLLSFFLILNLFFFIKKYFQFLEIKVRKV